MSRDSAMGIVLASLNICGGQWFEELKSYLEEMKSTVDIFCFQEVLDTPRQDKVSIAKIGEEQSERGITQKADIYSRLCMILEEYNSFFAWYSRLPVKAGPLYIGNAIFIRRGSKITNILFHGDEMVFGTRDSMRGADIATLPRSVQCMLVEFSTGKKLWLFNFHGLWIPQGKKDVPARLAQFEKLRDIVAERKGPKILAGDFNTSPDSESSRLLEGAGMDNLVRVYNISDTRGRLYSRGDTNGLHADNIFIQGVEIGQFEVPQTITASDHLPLVLRFWM